VCKDVEKKDRKRNEYKKERKELEKERERYEELKKLTRRI
jgi:hypothetical protein